VNDYLFTSPTKYTIGRSSHLYQTIEFTPEKKGRSMLIFCQTFPSGDDEKYGLKILPQIGPPLILTLILGLDQWIGI